ncbi:MAG: hypothetical protein AAGK71_03075 [Pseudomonadota bacterium]
MSLKVAPYKRDRMIERLPKDNDSLRDALEEALKRIETLEIEIARLRGELPPEKDET